MRPSDRLLLLVLGAGVIALFLYGFHGRGDSARVVHSSPPASEPDRAPDHEADYLADYNRFGELLAAYRAGEDEPLEALRAAGRTLAERHGRKDAADAVEYYARLTAEERQQGLEDFLRFRRLWQGVDEAEDEGWAEESLEFLAELGEFVTETRDRPDFVPAGRALSLAARIETRELLGVGRVPVANREVHLEAAIAHAREALAIFERAGMVTPRLEPLWLLGQLEALRKREPVAGAYFDECRELSIVTRQETFREYALLGRVSLARRVGDYVEAEEQLRELASFRTTEECWPLAMEHASLLIHDDEPERAEEFLRRTRPADPDDLIKWRILLAQARFRQGDFAEARAQLEKIDPEERGEDEILALGRLALLEGRSGEVIALFGGGGQVEAFSTRGRRYARTLLGEALLRENHPQAALAALQTARKIGERWEAQFEGRSPLQPTGASVMGEWQGLHTVALEARALVALGRELEAALLIERAQSEEIRLNMPRPVTLDDLLAWARSFEHGLVTWIAGADAGVAVHVAADGVVTALEIDHSRKELTRGVRRFREALLGGDDGAVGRISAQLGEALFPEGLREELRGADGEGRLLCLAHGPIERLALEALEFEGRPLDELAALLVLPALRDNHPGEAPTMGAWQLLGDPVDSTGRVRMLAAEGELSEVAALRPGASLVSREAFTREVCLDALRAEAPVHLATHMGADDSCPSGRFAAVGLELSGGDTLCAEEIGGGDSISPLVVLSACESSEGRFIDSRGLQGLTMAFLDAGTRNLLVTLWPVEDRSARRFTPHFHRAMLDGEPPSVAARSARRALAREGDSAADWAAFRVIGRD